MNSHGHTPIGLAIYHQRIDIARRLIQTGADVDQRFAQIYGAEQELQLPIIVAIEEEKTEIMKM